MLYTQVVLCLAFNSFTGILVAIISQQRIKKGFTACATYSGLIRPLVLVCKLYTHSRKACRPVARAPLVREFSNVAAILRLDWARPPHFYTRTRDPFPRRCALRELRNSRVLNSRAARLRLRDTHARARRLREYSYIHDEKWKYEPTFFLAKNKNEDSDLGWTADLKINLNKF